MARLIEQSARPYPVEVKIKKTFRSALRECVQRRAMTIRGPILNAVLMLLWSDEHRPEVLMSRRYLNAAPDNTYTLPTKLHQMPLGPAGNYLMTKEELNLALKEQSLMIITLGTKPAFPACKSVSGHEYMEGLKPDTRLLNLLNLSTIPVGSNKKNYILYLR